VDTDRKEPRFKRCSEWINGIPVIERRKSCENVPKTTDNNAESDSVVALERALARPFGKPK
jgi:hypothetical protein